MGQSTLPLSHPLANTQIYVLDAQLQALPTGVPGEIYISGAGVTRGYLNRPDLTAELFIPDPFSSATGTRMYRTGNLARHLSDGSIEFLGRAEERSPRAAHARYQPPQLKRTVDDARRDNGHYRLTSSL